MARDKKTKPIEVVPSASRFTEPVERYLAEYERMLTERQVALDHQAVRDAFVLLLQIEAIEDQLRTAFKRDIFWRV